MSILDSLKPADGAYHYKKRVGRGRGSGLGQTSGKGHKGQLARTGGRVRRGFEGGQTPLMRRLPKFGFSNVAFADKIETVTTAQIGKIDGLIDAASLQKAGLIKGQRVKVILNGAVTKALNLKVTAISQGAKSSIESAGGKVEVV